MPHLWYFYSSTGTASTATIQSICQRQMRAMWPMYRTSFAIWMISQIVAKPVTTQKSAPLDLFICLPSFWFGRHWSEFAGRAGHTVRNPGSRNWRRNWSSICKPIRMTAPWVRILSHPTGYSSWSWLGKWRAVWDTFSISWSWSVLRLWSGIWSPQLS